MINTISLKLGEEQMAARTILLLLTIGLMASRWDGQPVVAKTIESEIQISGNASLVIDVVKGVRPEDLLGRTLIFSLAGTKGQWRAVIYGAEWSGEHIRLIVLPKDGAVPQPGDGAVII